MKHLDQRSMGFLSALLLGSTPSVAQEQAQQQPGQVAESTAGEVGQRQTRTQTSAIIAPMERINHRIANRVQNRIRNRIDRHYAPQANTTSPFEVAADRAQSAEPR